MTSKLGARLGTVFRLLVVFTLLAVSHGVASAPEAAAHHQPAIWIGSPIIGTWGAAGYPDTLPSVHHKLFKAAPQNDFSVDLSAPDPADKGVYVFAAPSDSALNNRVTAKIEQIVDEHACRYGGGGDFVTVGFYLDGVRYGRVTYAHIERDMSLYVGKPIGRWGTWIGSISWPPASTGGSNCWTGPHVHVELRSEAHWACWNKGWRLGQRVERTNFIGFVSGPLGSSPASCP